VGGLVKPPGYRHGDRYPIVIQTYGFDPNVFLVDGNHGQTTAYAARPLASRGLLVLQLATTDSDSARIPAGQPSAENDRFVYALEGAIDELNRRGLIDPARIGLIGFSREGMHVEYFLAFSKYRIAAATISDSVSATPFCYCEMFGQPFPGMATTESNDVIGAALLGKGVSRWIDRSAIFHLDQITAPIRFEHIGTSFVPCHWDMYALLSRYGRPTEMIHIPGDEHILRTPMARVVSQEGNVDWFDFWLKDHEDPSDLKRDQYERWNRLRSARQTLLTK